MPCVRVRAKLVIINAACYVLLSILYSSLFQHCPPFSLTSPPFSGYLATHWAQRLIWHTVISNSSDLVGTSSFRFRLAPPLPSPSVGHYAQASFAALCQNMLVTYTGSLWHGAERNWCPSSWDTLSTFGLHLHVFCLV